MQNPKYKESQVEGIPSGKNPDYKESQVEGIPSVWNPKWKKFQVERITKGAKSQSAKISKC